MKNTTDIAGYGVGGLVDIFADRERNALMTAINNAARSAGYVHSNGAVLVYGYLEETPKTSLASELVDELHRLGYKIALNGHTE